MEVFTQFSSDLDDATKDQLSYGQGLMRLLRQDQYHPLRQYEQVILLTAALSRIMTIVPREDLRSYARELLDHFRRERPGLCERIERTGLLSQEDREEIIQASRDYTAKKAEERRW